MRKKNYRPKKQDLWLEILFWTFGILFAGASIYTMLDSSVSTQSSNMSQEQPQERKPSLQQTLRL